jgi:hypothetical protein
MFIRECQNARRSSSSESFKPLEWMERSMADSLDIADECRRKAIEAEDLARKATDPLTRKSYEDIAMHWRKLAEHAEMSDDET